MHRTYTKRASPLISEMMPHAELGREGWWNSKSAPAVAKNHSPRCHVIWRSRACVHVITTAPANGARSVHA